MLPVGMQSLHSTSGGLCLWVSQLGHDATELATLGEVPSNQALGHRRSSCQLTDQHPSSGVSGFGLRVKGPSARRMRQGGTQRTYFIAPTQGSVFP